jgi:hypothetical protein
VGKKLKLNFIFSLPVFAHLAKWVGIKRKYLSGGQNKNKNLFWNKIYSETGQNTIYNFRAVGKNKMLFLFQIANLGCRRVR